MVAEIGNELDCGCDCNDDGGETSGDIKLPAEGGEVEAVDAAEALVSFVS
jgi:hypothetical protein